MRLVIQRVLHASVSIRDQVVGRIGPGMLILCGVGNADTDADALWLARKVSRLRIFSDADGKMNESIAAVPGGAFLVISQFTLYGDCRKGNRPGYTDAASPEPGRRGYEQFVASLRAEGFPVETGTFGGDMQVALVNDGPVTLILESTGRDQA